MDRGDPVFKIIIDIRASKNSIYKLRKKAISLGWLPGTLVELRHIDDRPQSGRPKVSIYITAIILTTLT
jgi:hypothetical protein